MKELRPAMKLTVAVGGEERHAHLPLHEEVLRIFHEEGIAGATLTTGVLSYGFTKTFRRISNEVQMENLPVIIEAVDEADKVERVANLIAGMLAEHGLVQVQPTLIARDVDSLDKEMNRC